MTIDSNFFGSEYTMTRPIALIALVLFFGVSCLRSEFKFDGLSLAPIELGGIEVYQRAGVAAVFAARELASAERETMRTARGRTFAIGPDRYCGPVSNARRTKGRDIVAFGWESDDPGQSRSIKSPGAPVDKISRGELDACELMRSVPQSADDAFNEVLVVCIQDEEASSGTLTSLKLRCSGVPNDQGVYEVTCIEVRDGCPFL